MTTVPYTPEDLAGMTRWHEPCMDPGCRERGCGRCSCGAPVYPCSTLRLLATIEDRDMEIARLRNGLTEVIDCSAGSNPEEIMAGIARRTLGPCQHLMPVGARTIGDELISWKCVRCGEWIRE